MSEPTYVQYPILLTRVCCTAIQQLFHSDRQLSQLFPITQHRLKFEGCIDPKTNDDRQIRRTATLVRTNTGGRILGASHWNRPTPFDDIVIQRQMLIFGSPFKATVLHRSVKASGDPPKAKSDICCPDTYLSISNLCKVCREIKFAHVITASSFSSACIAEPEEEGTSCRWSPGPGTSSFSCFCSSHSGWASENACTFCFGVGRWVSQQRSRETHIPSTRCH